MDLVIDREVLGSDWPSGWPRNASARERDRDGEAGIVFGNAIVTRGELERAGPFEDRDFQGTALAEDGAAGGVAQRHEERLVPFNHSISRDGDEDPFDGLAIMEGERSGGCRVVGPR